MGIVLGSLIPYTSFGSSVGMTPLPAMYFGYLAATVMGYMILVTVIKKLYVRKHGELL